MLALLLAAAAAPAGAVLHQYSSAGHVLGFRASEYYVANRSCALKVEFVGAALTEPVTETRQRGPRSGAAPLGRVTYAGLWEGISVTFDSPGAGIVRSTWRLDPEADPRDIRMRYSRPVQRAANGTLTVASYATGALSESAPVAWQEVRGERRGVDVAFAVRGEHEVGFEVGSHDPALPLVIDPTLAWNTFLGGEGADQAAGIALDGEGNVFVAGSSSDTWGSPVRARSAGIDTDAFAAKLDPDGTLLWNTFLGGSSEDLGYGIELDGSGNVYVLGNSEGTWGSPVRAHSVTSRDAFSARLDGSGTLVWNTFLGGADSDEGVALAVEGSGDVCVTGLSSATWGTPILAFTPGVDAFAAKLDANGVLLWNTFLGTGNDGGQGIAVDGSGDIYLAGFSGATWGSPVRAYTADYDAFAAQLDGDGNLVWNTFLGGASEDGGSGIALDGSGNLYVAGSSDGTWGSPERAYSAGEDLFAAKLDTGGTLLWNTFLGGGGDDRLHVDDVIAADGAGNVYLAGYSNVSWGTPDQAYTPVGFDVFVAKLDEGGTLRRNTFLGSNLNDRGLGVAGDGAGNIYVAGDSFAAWGSPVRAFSMFGEGFVAKLSDLSVLEIPTLSGAGVLTLILVVAAAALIALRTRAAGEPS